MSSSVQNGQQQRSASRSSSLASRFLSRSKSTEPLTERKTSGGRLLRKKSIDRDDELRRQQASEQAPALPTYTPQPKIATFGGDMAGQREQNRGAALPKGAIPSGRTSEEPIDPYARTESMTHRGRYSYASSAVSTLNNPRRVRRRKDPTPYNVLVIGSRNSGKTSFLNFLKTSLALPPKKRPARGEDVFDTPPAATRANRNFTHHYLETEIDGERVGLTMWDSQGLEKNVVDLQLREMSAFLESKFEDTFNEEMKVIRAPGVQDTHIHCVFLILDPVRLDGNIAAAQQKSSNGAGNTRMSNLKNSRIVGGLDEDFDVQVLRTLQGKTTVIPVISKADTITAAHMAVLKQTVSDSLKKAGLDPLEALNLDGAEDDDGSEDMDRLDEREEDEAAAIHSADDDAEDTGSPRSRQTDDSDTVPNEQPTPAVRRRASHKRESSTASSMATAIRGGYIPMSILSPDVYSLPPHPGPIGRKFPWGFADPYKPEHCDFVKLKDACFGEWRADLREASKEVFYERWRTSRLNRQGVSANGAGRASTTGARKASGGVPAGILKNQRNLF